MARPTRESVGRLATMIQSRLDALDVKAKLEARATNSFPFTQQGSDLVPTDTKWMLRIDRTDDGQGKGANIEFDDTFDPSTISLELLLEAIAAILRRKNVLKNPKKEGGS